jgi:hypothetical protein
VSLICYSTQNFPNVTQLKQFEMEAKEQVLEAMKLAGAPVNAGKVVELTGLDRKVVDKAMALLKKEEAIESPVRCYWQPKQ